MTDGFRGGRGADRAGSERSGRSGPLRRSARARILGWYVVMLVLAIAASLLVERQVLMVRLSHRTDTQLQIDAAAIDHAAHTGATPPSVTALFSAYLKTNVPGPDGEVLTLVSGKVFQASAGSAYPLQDIPGFVAEAAFTSRATYGTVHTPGAGPARYLIVPVSQPGSPSGTFVAAVFTQSSVAQVNSDVEVAAVVSLTILLLMTLVAWGVAGRVLAPVRVMTETAVAIGESDLTRRIPRAGHDEISALAGAFNSMLDRLEAAVTSQRDFVSDAGHELRTPITVIRGHLELLGDDPDERAEVLAVVNDELARMSRMVDDLLLLAKTERPDFLVMKPVRLEDLIPEVMLKVVTLQRRDWRSHVGGRATTMGDRQRLTQALMQLCDNAVGHTGVGDEITIGLDVDRRTYRLWVQDTGAGIPLEDQARIFDRFARGRNERRRGSGSGLGLSIVSAIADAHRGTVEVTSAVGQGSTFTLVLPLQPPEERS